MVKKNPFEFCEKCNHTGWILDIKTNKAKHCECFSSVIIEQKITNSGIPSRYSQCSIDNFDTLDNKNLNKALKRATGFVTKYPAVKKGLLFMGNSGTGKTHLSVAILIQLIRQKAIDGLFIDYQEMLRSVQESYSPESGKTEYYVLEPILEADLLVIDDVGSKKATEWVRDTLAYIINHRYNEGSSTIITTNYLDEDINNDVNETLADRVGVRIRSRLYEMCERVEMEGDDFRKQFKIR
ncbi:MAG: ATP-binding protein [Acidobacteria bacterium]|nr:ATP-binding protein [Acidobacteriota bacterium]